MDYDLIRSKRKTISLEIRPDGTLLVRAPQSMPKREIHRFVHEHAGWIEKHRRMIREREAQKEQDAQAKPDEGVAGKRADLLSMEEIRALADQAKEDIPARVRHFAPIVGVTYGRITIRNQKTRWGSCSSKGNLNFNCLLMLMPEEIRDYVVVHELSHRKEMNHSAAFWAIVESVLPDYRERRKWLRDHGEAYIRRMTG